MIKVFRQIAAYPKVVIRNRDLLGSFVARELRSRFEGSLLGRLWPVLNPAILVCIYYLVFVKILQMKYDGLVDENGYLPGLGLKPNTAMGLYLVTGILPWVAFSESLLRSTNSVIEHGNLIKKVAFPSELLVTYICTVSIFNFLIALPIYLILHYSVGGWICPHIIWLPLVVVLQLLFTIGLGMVLATLNVFIRDTAQFVALITMLWMFLTPIFYPADLALRKLSNAPDSGPYELSMAAEAFALNPLLQLMNLYRGALLERRQPFPLESLGTFALMTAVVLVIGLAVYQSAKDRFADEV